MATSVPSDTAFDSTIGAFQIGVMISIFLFGLVTVQVFSYYKKFPKDSWKMKTFVGVVWIMELTHTALTAHSIYFITVTKYGQQQFINKFPATLVPAVVFSGIIGPSIQAFFAYRVYRLSSSWIIPIACWILSLLRCISLMAVAGAAHTSTSVTGFREQWLWLLTSSLSVSAAVDVLIAASLCFFLWRKRDNTFARTRRVVDHLILWSIQTGLLTSLATITMLILFIVAHSFAWMAIFFIISRLFSNSLLASLNARTSLRNNMGDKVHFVGEDSSSFRLQSAHSRGNINVAMTKVTDVQWDPENGSHSKARPTLEST